MSDNEKRAHDLALSFWQTTIARVQSQEHKNLSPYEAYKRAYDEALESLNCDFPDAK